MTVTCLLGLVVALAIFSCAEAVLPCTMTSKQLNSNDVVNSSCTNITYVNVTASTSAVVNISIGSMILANPSAHAILVSLLRFSVIDGATIIIDCSGCDNNNNKVSPALLPVVSIYIMSLQGQNGALVFAGSFPNKTSILVTEANMTLDVGSSAPNLNWLDPFNPQQFQRS